MLYSRDFLPPSLKCFLLHVPLKHQDNHITHYSYKSILIQVLSDFKYLPRGPLKKR